MALTDIKCRNAKPAEKSYKIFDGGGLYLEVMPTGKKLWRLKYYYLKKEKRISFGAYPLVSLLEAREQRERSKKLLLDNIDPSKHRQDNISEFSKKSENTFKAVALEWIERKKPEWSEVYYNKIESILERHLFPALAKRPLEDIKPPELLSVLEKIEEKGFYDIMKKARGISGMIFRYGIQTGRCEWNAAENLRGALGARKTRHYASLSEKRLPDFIRALERNEARLYERTRRAVWFSLYTFQRPGEIRQAEWSEIHWEDKEWHIPAEKMKMDKAHIVPLSDQALEILEEQKKEVEDLKTNWVFPSQHSFIKPMSDGTVNKAIQRLGFGEEMKAHGFRALARTLIRERLKFEAEIIEKQLAHHTKNPLGEAYDRTQWLVERKEMMGAWADYLTALAQPNVVQGDFVRRA